MPRHCQPIATLTCVRLSLPARSACSHLPPCFHPITTLLPCPPRLLPRLPSDCHPIVTQLPRIELPPDCHPPIASRHHVASPVASSLPDCQPVASLLPAHCQVASLLPALYQIVRPLPHCHCQNVGMNRGAWDMGLAPPALETRGGALGLGLHCTGVVRPCGMCDPCTGVVRPCGICAPLLALARCDVQHLCSPPCSGMVRRVESGVPRVFFRV